MSPVAGVHILFSCADGLVIWHPGDGAGGTGAGGHCLDVDGHQDNLALLTFVTAAYMQVS